jgi:hypothetical protein
LWVKVSPRAVTVLQSAAKAVAESPQTITPATKPNFMDCIAPSKKKNLTRTLGERMTFAKERNIASWIHSQSVFAP